MQTVPSTTGPVHPAAFVALERWLRENHYSEHAIDQLVAHAHAEGTPTGSPYLDREDEAAASEVFVEAMPAVPYGSPLWGSGPLRGGAPEVFTPSAEDWADYRRWTERLDALRDEEDRPDPEPLYGYE
jgi:hypothetical protein